MIDLQGVSWFHWWLAGAGIGLIVDLLYRGFGGDKRLCDYLTFGWDVLILCAHGATEDYRWIFLCHACKIGYLVAARTRHLVKIVQVDAYHVLAFFLVVHGGKELGLETFDVMSWEFRFHFLTTLYNAIPLLGKNDRPLVVWLMTMAWIVVRVLLFVWETRGSYYFATVALTQALVLISLTK
jgi:hypothetical protein